MDILEQPAAQALLADAELDPAALDGCLDHLERFAQRYLPHFTRTEQRQHALVLLHGKLTGLQRKTTEPMATAADLDRRPLQLFVGAGAWQDHAVLEELRCHVQEEIGDPDAVFVVDGSGFPKKGVQSCGVARQWCGRLGKVENCQVGVFLAYVSRHGQTLLEGRLYLPKEWAEDPVRRVKTHVPAAVTFQEGWRIGLDLLDRGRAALPGAWVAADDEFGRVAAFRARLRGRKLRYVVDVPCNTLVRDTSARRPPARPGGKPRLPEFERVEVWVARQPGGRWRKVRLRDGSQGPREVKVLLATLQVKDEDGCVGGRERLVAINGTEPGAKVSYALSNDRQAGRKELAGVRGSRHGVEELLEEGKGEVGLAHYEVRSWVGWHHHVTLTLLALWFLQLERRRLKKNAGAECCVGAGDLQRTAT
jgi:SRSO17 transposase